MNEFFTNEYTAVIQKLVNEVVNDPSTYLGAKYIPSVALPVDKVRVEVIEASGGLTQEHAMGTDPKYVQSGGTRVQEFSPPAYKEAIHYDEKKILHLRQLGQNDPSKRGIRQYLDRDIDRLNRRLEARIEKLRWDAIFQGSFTYMGQVFSYGIPSANCALPLGGLWSTDGINPNNSANPIADIRYWVNGGLARFRKYSIKRMVMNPNTARWVLENANTKQYLSSIGANPNISEWTLPKLLGFLVPGGPEGVIYDGWYQTETADSAGKLTVSDATYFIPDGKIFFEATLPNGDLIGEFVQGIHLASGSIDAPGYGKFLVVEENIAPGTKGGPGNPYIDVFAGVYGGVNLFRQFDVLTASVGPA
jgi:Phage major capsid protein E